MIENQTETKIKKFRSERGGEYIGNEFEKYLLENGILHEKTNPDSPEQNGAAERLNRLLDEGVRATLAQKSLTNKFWWDAANYVIHTKNRVIHTRTKEIPFETFWKKKADLSKLQIFGEKCVYRPPGPLAKTQPKGKHAIFIGFEHGVKGYRLRSDNRPKTYLERRHILHKNGRILRDNGRRRSKRGGRSADLPKNLRRSNEIKRSRRLDSSHRKRIEKFKRNRHVRRSYADKPEHFGRKVVFYTKTGQKESAVCRKGIQTDIRNRLPRNVRTCRKQQQQIL